MSRINQKMGLKPQTKARQATHSHAIASRVQCPECSSQHVNATQSSNGKRLGAYWCAACSTFFDRATITPSDQKVA